MPELRKVVGSGMLGNLVEDEDLVVGCSESVVSEGLGDVENVSDIPWIASHSVALKPLAVPKTTELTLSQAERMRLGSGPQLWRGSQYMAMPPVQTMKRQSRVSTMCQR